MPHATDHSPRLNREYDSRSASTSSKVGNTGKSSQCATCAQDADESNFATTAHADDTAATENGSVLMSAASKKSLLSKADLIALLATFGILVIPQIFEISDSALLLIVLIQLIFTAAYSVVIFRRFRARQFYKTSRSQS